MSADIPIEGHPRVSVGGAVRTAAVLGLLGVGLGAFGAHGLKGTFTDSALDAAAAAERMEWWKTAALYHLLHAGALGAGGTACALAGRSSRALTWCMGLGVAIFSGTLYAMALGAPRWFGAITPIGGLLLMAGWATLIVPGRRASAVP